MNNPINILSKCLGNPRRLQVSEKQEYEFNCPICDGGRNKYNLGINLKKQVVHCWSCDNIKGSLLWFMHHYFPNIDYDKFAESLSSIIQYQIGEKYDFTNFKFDTLKLSIYDNKCNMDKFSAYRYWCERGLTMSDIEANDVRYTSDNGNFLESYRIILPNYNCFGKINYWVGRAYYSNIKPKYYSPSVSKENIIFGESKINWKSMVILVEGVFDALVVPNAIPMLGKSPNSALLQKLLYYNSKVTVCLDSDAQIDVIKLCSYLLQIGINEVNYIPMKEDDLSCAYMNGGVKKICEILKTAKIINDKKDVLRERLGMM